LVIVQCLAAKAAICGVFQQQIVPTCSFCLIKNIQMLLLFDNIYEAEAGHASSTELKALFLRRILAAKRAYPLPLPFKDIANSIIVWYDLFDRSRLGEGSFVMEHVFLSVPRVFSEVFSAEIVHFFVSCVTE
jgi:hypothetical protein